MKYLFAVLSIITANALNAQSNWKQQVDTKIDVRLDDKGHFLHGFEEFTYTNNSPDTLKFIYVHLWMNAYKNDRTPFARQQDINGNTEFYYSKKRDRGFIDSLQFSVEGRNVEHYSTEDAPDIARIDLPEPLLPGGKIKVSTPFRDKLPKVFSRGGHTDQAYYVSQWFPKPAVYDRKGWHPISYLDQGEFYSEYGSYDVSVTLPSNYVLLATGNCLDESENKWLDSLSQVPLPPFSTWLSDFPASAYTTKTVHFHEDNIHDFAWFADKRFIVRKDTVVSPGNDQLVTAWTGFLPFYQLYWKNGTEHLKTALKYYGSLVGPYPYKTIKAVLGDMKSGGGMEYPTITLIAKTAVSSLKTVIVHEAGHNWFYGMLGSNERDHAWMDEGLNTFYEQKTIQGSRKDTLVKTGLDETLIYYQYAATNSDQPIDQPSENFEKTHYGIDIYNKTGLMLRWLELYMGEKEFGEGMKDYYNTWVFRHPYPEDFRAVMSKHTTKSLDWFFETMLHTDKKIDYYVSKARKKDGSTEVTIRNKSGVNGPAHLQAYHRDSLVADMWSEPFDRSATLTVPTTTWNRLVVSDEVPDAKTTNNVYRRSGLFHHFGFRLKPVLGTNRREFDKLFVAPAVGSNLYDGFMAGLLFHDLTLPENRFRFALAPMYAFASKTFVGSGSMGYMWYSSGLFKEILLQGDAKTYHFEETKVNLADPLYARYIKAAPSLEFIFNEHDLRSPVTRGLLLKGYYIQEDNFNFGSQPSDVPYLVQGHTYYGRLYYHHKNERAYNPFSYNLDVHGNADFIKIGLEGKVRIDYNTPKKALYVRGYAGKFFALNNDPAAVSRYYLNSSYSGTNDYLYDGTYRGRNATSHISGQQISIQEGGFKIPVHMAVNRSDNWIGALNLATDLPLGPIPIRLFFDAGLIPNYNQGPKNVKSSTLIYDGGVEVVLSKDVASVYFPFIMSGDFRDYLNNTYGHKNVIPRSISFTLQLQNINWLRLPGTGLKKALK